MFLYKICPTSTPDAVGTSSCSESTLLMINGQQWRANIALCEVLESNYTVPQKNATTRQWIDTATLNLAWRRN